ncbi:hypothetical protein WOSG25_070590 [Weissella oryzae SG25]|uniref:Uncharacterized protein n=1 Tax=Weissella oryzae (strain DSM 25784 / JCM 18191 / LMG 30913 / SG25) TaxID=1329250 RepID=A0A069CUK6_WEIOS|nr:hypothetical protein [Weissella oryzae]GAK31082.1 hypothetical protein WOSG25_070590 [Weissella oryzae SG25]
MVEPRPIVYYENLANSHMHYVDQLMAQKVSYILLVNSNTLEPVINLDQAAVQVVTLTPQKVVAPAKTTKEAINTKVNHKRLPKVSTGLGLKLDDIIAEEAQVAAKKTDDNYFTH